MLSVKTELFPDYKMVIGYLTSPQKIYFIVLMQKKIVKILKKMYIVKLEIRVHYANHAYMNKIIFAAIIILALNASLFYIYRFLFYCHY